MHIGLVVCHVGCNLYTQDGILPFVKSIEDLAKARERRTHNKDAGGACSYALLVANYGPSLLESKNQLGDAGVSQTSNNAVNNRSPPTLRCYMLQAILGGVVPTVPSCLLQAFQLS